MTFMVVLVCLAIQRFLGHPKIITLMPWFTQYMRWMPGQFAKFKFVKEPASVIWAVLALLIVVAVLTVLCYTVGGKLAYFIFSLVILWYCLDAQQYRAVDSQKVASASSPQESSSAIVDSSQQVFLSAYYRVFAMIFWFVILGPWVVALYRVLLAWHGYLKKQSVDEFRYQKACHGLQDLLDWIPLRLLGLTFALVGQFAPIFASWLKQFFVWGKTSDLLLEWGHEAEKHADDQARCLKGAKDLIDRALLLWLVLLALYSVGTWVG